MTVEAERPALDEYSPGVLLLQQSRFTKIQRGLNS